MSDDELNRIAVAVGEVVDKRLDGVEKRLDGVCTDLAAIRAEMATKTDLTAIHTRFDRLEVKMNERLDELQR